MSTQIEKAIINNIAFDEDQDGCCDFYSRYMYFTMIPVVNIFLEQKECYTYILYMCFLILNNFVSVFFSEILD